MENHNSRKSNSISNNRKITIKEGIDDDVVEAIVEIVVVAVVEDEEMETTTTIITRIMVVETEMVAVLRKRNVEDVIEEEIATKAEEVIMEEVTTTSKIMEAAEVETINRRTAKHLEGASTRDRRGLLGKITRIENINHDIEASCD